MNVICKESQHLINKGDNTDFVLSVQTFQFIIGVFIATGMVLFLNLDMITWFMIFLAIMFIYAILMIIFPPIQILIYFFMGLLFGFIIGFVILLQVTSELSLKAGSDFLFNN